jgi:hypothetical protein
MDVRKRALRTTIVPLETGQPYRRTLAVNSMASVALASEWKMIRRPMLSWPRL